LVPKEYLMKSTAHKAPRHVVFSTPLFLNFYRPLLLYTSGR
jgi:hypothetical protein